MDIDSEQASAVFISVWPSGTHAIRYRCTPASRTSAAVEIMAKAAAYVPNCSGGSNRASITLETIEIDRKRKRSAKLNIRSATTLVRLRCDAKRQMERFEQQGKRIIIVVRMDW